ncbi:MAG: murein biosynthesis integral membrane protein MurJ [Firmicutes bacterium]|nr:murein biosynthesis integral membrane protein MurJ [Bacillota bacterium]
MSKTLLRTSSILFVLFVASRILGFIREQVVAAYLGATPQSDAYVVAATIPFILSYIIGTAAGNSFLPVYTGRLGDKDANRLASTVFVIFGGAVVLICVGGFLFAPYLVDLLAPGFAADVRSLAVVLTKIMLPGLAFLTLGYVVKAALNAHRQFTVPAAAPALQNIVFIILLLFFAQKGAVGLAWSMLAGTVVFYLVQRIVAGNYGITWRPQLDFKDPDVRRVMVLAVPVILTTLGTKGYIFLDRWLGSQLSGGSIAALNFADRIRELPYGLFVAAVSTVLFPTLASAASKQDMQSLRKNTAMGLRMVAMLGFPAAVLLSLLDRPVVRLLFERGAFDAVATTATAGALGFYAVSVIALCANSIITYTFLSMQDGIIPLKIGAAALGVNLAADLLLVNRMGHVGLALGNTLAAFFAMFLFVSLLSRRLEGFAWQGLLVSVFKIGIAAAVLGVISVGLAHWTGLYNQNISLFSQIWGLGLSVGVGGLVYVALLFVFRIEETRMFSGR